MPRLKIDTDVNMSDLLSKQQLKRSIDAMSGDYEILCKPIDIKRSNQQNRFFWRVVCQTLAEWFTNQGQPMTKDQAKEILCDTYLPVEFVNPVSGEVKLVGGSTSVLSGPEFSEFLENCIAGMAHYGIPLPDPPPTDDMKGGKQTKYPPAPVMQP